MPHTTLFLIAVESVAELAIALLFVLAVECLKARLGLGVPYKGD